ncbi:FGFR1 oncogene partner 2 homolog [Patella vulgata]|uniref:FGFR1 oncogene partner 2 homolog n=1 Tax=Patella vulgata TaxID=6465 RepID=UPI0021806D98|nr:FGFR1 oncogene partner 2 homolog [Patella vulgata]
MALTIERLLEDAHLLITRLKDHDATADILISNTQTLHTRVDGMKQYQDDITELNEIAKHRPRSTLVLGIAQENRQIRELQQENHELQMSLEDHQSALELIMQKYREQVAQLIHGNKVEAIIANRSESSKEDVTNLLSKIHEMAAVMKKAVDVDEEMSTKEYEELTKLKTENQTLREILEICTTSKDRIVQDEDTEDKSSQTENT